MKNETEIQNNNKVNHIGSPIRKYENSKREEEFAKVKKLIKEYFPEADYGLFDSRNMTGDSMSTIFDGEYFTLDICYNWSYFEVFGTNQREFEELEEMYSELVKDKMRTVAI